MNISSLYLDRSVFSGHTCRATDGESNAEVKVSPCACIVLVCCDTESQPGVKKKNPPDYSQGHTTSNHSLECLEGVKTIMS